MAKYHKINTYFSTNAIVASCHAPPQIGLVPKRRTSLSWKVVNTDIKLVPLMPNEDKNIGYSLVLDLKTLYRIRILKAPNCMIFLQMGGSA